MDIKHPLPLKIGDTIGIVSPSFFIEKEENAKRAFNWIGNEGYQIKYGQNVFKRYQNTTASAIERANEINSMFANPEIKAIICSDGGSRAIEILEFLDYDLIASNPKIFSGFSDITHISLALLAKSGLTTIHGLDIINGFGAAQDNHLKNKNIDFFLQLCSKSSQDIDVPEITNREVWKDGRCEGTLIGGWLEAIANLSNTPYFPYPEDVILFWEAISLERNKIMMLLNALKLAPWFKNIRGIIIGKLNDCDEKEYWDCIPELRNAIEGMMSTLNIPVVANFDFGHGSENISMPIGVRMKIDTKLNLYKLVESYIR